jgi:lysyl-tRNA synthetase class 2
MTTRQTDHSWAPRVAAAGAVLVGLVSIASALTPNISWRGHLLLELEPVEALQLFHVLAVPAGVALLLISPYLAMRRRRAATAAVALILALAVLDMLKGLDYEEALLCLLAAAGVYLTRRAFDVEHEPITSRSAIWRLALLGTLAAAFVPFAGWAAGAIFHHHLRSVWMPMSMHSIAIATLLAVAYALFRPLSAPREPPLPASRRLAADLIRTHGADSLSFFKLRSDKHYFFNEERTAFVGYRVQAGVLIVSGDPVGPQNAVPGLLASLRVFARARGLRLAAVGASERMLAAYERLGLRSIYLGDEAIVKTAAFSLVGRPIRKVRQSVTRLRKAGYTAQLCTLDALDPHALAQVHAVLEAGRQGAPERGFSMAMDSIRCDCEQDTLFVLGRDGEGAVRGVLHFVPCYGRDAVSLSFMRRDPDTPNGLTEFLVAEAVTLLCERGIEECSLNFATAARFMNDPSNVAERAIGRAAKWLNPYFQIESLYRFNAKFFPRWEPRYAVYEGRLGLPRMALAAMWAEGQLPKPGLARRRRGHAAAGRSSAASLAG